MRRLSLLLLFVIPVVLLTAESEKPAADKTGEVFLLNYWGKMFNSSSELEKPATGKIGKYAAGNLIDKKLNTSWVEGVKGDGIGEYVLLADKEIPKTISIYSGYSKNISLFKKNNRPSKLRLSLYFGMADSWGGEYGDYYRIVKYKKEYVLALKDTISLQTFNFPFRETLKDTRGLKAFREKSLEILKQAGRRKGVPPFPGHPDTEWILKLEIAGVYRGSKWQDTCISEVFFNDRYISDVHQFKYKDVKKVYESEDGGKVFMTAGEITGDKGSGKDGKITLWKSNGTDSFCLIADNV
ncbi:MAG: hypothetical protein DRP57_09455, partial [Spirochaetes bacterium]